MQQVINYEVCSPKQDNDLEEAFQELDKLEQDGKSQLTSEDLEEINQGSSNQSTSTTKEAVVVDYDYSVENNETTLKLFENQVKVMILFKRFYDIQGMYRNRCTYTYDAQDDNYDVSYRVVALGNSLSEQISEQKIPQDYFYIITLMCRIAGIVKKLHDNDLLHMNLQSSNISFLNIYTLQLGGLERCIFPNDNLVVPVMTNQYTTPEMEENVFTQVQVSGGQFQYDIFSLGIIFYEIAANKILQSKSEIDFSACKKKNAQSNLCNLQSVILPMINQDPSKRPHISIVIKSLLGKVFDYIKLNEQDYTNKIEQEFQYYEQTKDQNTLYYMDQIKFNYQKRRKILDTLLEHKNENFEDVFKNYIVNLQQNSRAFSAYRMVLDKLKSGLHDVEEDMRLLI